MELVLLIFVVSAFSVAIEMGEEHVKRKQQLRLDELKCDHPFLYGEVKPIQSAEGLGSRS